MTTIERIMQKGNRTRLIIALVLIGAVVAAGVFFNKYIINFINGPYVVEPESLLEVESVSSASQIYVTLEDVIAFDSGYYEYTTENGRNTGTSAYYGVTPIGNYFLLVKTKDLVIDDNSYTWTGELTPFSSGEQRDIVADIEREIPEVRGFILPFKLSTVSGFRNNVMIGLAIGGVALLVGLWYLSRWFVFSTNPESHPVMKKLRHFGDPSSVAQQIEMELSAGNAQKLKSAQFTRNWLLHTTSGGFNATRHQDIIWLYQKVVSGRYGKTYYAAINDRFGQSFTIQAGQNDVAAILQTAAMHAPWAIMGHDKEIQKLWNNQRDQMIAAVEQRKVQVAQQQRIS